MALTNAVQARGHLGPTKAVLVRVTFDSSYPTSGESFTPADVGLQSFLAVFTTPARNGTEFVGTKFDPGTNKIFAYWTGGAVSSELDEITNADDLSSFVCDVLCIGH